MCVLILFSILSINILISCPTMTSCDVKHLKSDSLALNSQWLRSGNKQRPARRLSFIPCLLVRSRVERLEKIISLNSCRNQIREPKKYKWEINRSNYERHLAWLMSEDSLSQINAIAVRRLSLMAQLFSLFEEKPAPLIKPSYIRKSGYS